MLSLDAAQLALVAADDKTIRWVTTVTDINSVEYTSANYVMTDFSGVELRRNMAENTIIAPSNITFSISNAGDALDFAVFKGGSVLIELYLSTVALAEQKIAGWKFRIKTADPSYQNLKITAEDFLQTYLNGTYPNTRRPDDIFPSNRTYTNDALCVPVPFGTAYVPLRDVFITGEGGFILLGDTVNTYTITKIRSPRSWGAKSEWDSGSYTFTQSTKADADAANWRVFQAMIADGAAGFWGTPGGPILDPPVRFSRSDTVSITNPADVIAFVLKDMGVPTAMIDEAGTFATAHTTFDGWGLTFNGAFWYKQDREKVLAQLLTMCHSCLDVGETIKLRVLSKTSKKTITGAEVQRTSEQGEGTFNYRDLANEDLADSGFIAYQPSGESQDELIKALVGIDGSPDVLSNDVLECHFVQDSQDVKRIGTLHFERKLMKEAEAGFTTKGTCLALQPDDVITINDTNYGGSYAVLVDSVKIGNDISIRFVCSHFSIPFNDWADLTPAILTVPDDSTDGSWQIVMSGPDDDYDLNALKGQIRIGTNPSHILITPHDPLRISMYDTGNEILRLGNLNGFAGYVSAKYGLAAYIDANNYFKIDPTNGIRMSGSIVLTNQISSSDISDVGANADQTNYTDSQIANIFEENSVLTISRPVGASYSNATSSVIGAIKITLPQSWTATMMKFTVDVFNYVANGISFSIELSGYNYSTTTQWHKTTASLSGSIAANNRVRFGHDGTKCCIYIGETTSNWSFPNVSVRDFQAGHLNYAKDQWDDGWSIEITTSIGTVTSDISDSLIDANATRYVNNVASTTLIVGGKIGTGLVIADSISVANLSAISADVGALTAGTITGITITGGTIRTSSGNQKVQLSSANNRLEVYNSTPTLIGRFGGTGNGNVININQVNTGTTYPPIYITSAQNSNIFNIFNTHSSTANYPAFRVESNSSSTSLMYLKQTGSRRCLSIEGNSSTYGALKVYQLGSSYLINTNVAGCYLTKAGVWTDASSKTLKENFEDIKVLDIIKNLDIKRYNYINERKQSEAEIRKRIINNKKREKYILTHDHPKCEGDHEDYTKYEKEKLKDEENIEVENMVTKEYAYELERKVPKHFSPMSEEFYEAFGIGDNKGISAKDLAGIALQAVKELSQQVDKLNGGI